MRLLSLLLTVALAMAFAQTRPPDPTIRLKGIVVESGSNRPISGVEIVVNAVQRSVDGQSVAPRKISSDSQGRFQLVVPAPAIRYVIQVLGDSSPGASRVLEPQALEREIRLELVRPARVTARVIDDGTGQPIGNLRIAALPKAVMIADRLGSSLNLARRPFRMTDADGVFDTESIPGEFTIVALPRLWSLDGSLLQSFESEAAATAANEIVDQDYAPLYWPGGDGPQTAQTAMLAGGSTLDAGTLRLRTTDYYRAKVTVAGIDCTEERDLTIGLSAGGGPWLHPGAVPCGKPFLIRGLPPGSYRLLVWDEFRADQQDWRATLPFVIANGNVALSISLQPAITLEGTVKLPTGVTLDPATASLTIEPADAAAATASSTAIVPDQQGRFRIDNLPRGKMFVSLRGVTPRLVLERVAYGGREGFGFTFDWDGSARLEIELSDQPATISGRVGAAGFVAALPWPLPDAEEPVPVGALLQLTGATQTSPNGQFEIHGLRGGEYRAVAIDSPELLWGGATAMELGRLAQGGEPVKLAPGGAANISLKLLRVQP